MNEQNINKNEKNIDSPIEKHTTKSFVSAFILGLFIGLAVIVPGVSGSTVAIIFGLYTGMLWAIGNIFSSFKKCVAFLLPIGIGAVVGFLGGFIVIQKVFALYLFPIVCLFAGLMTGAVPAITAEIKGTKKSFSRSILFTVGILIPIAIGLLSISLSSGEELSASFESFPLWRPFAYLLLGFAVSVTQIVPGLSATAILMALGQFRPILNSLHLDYILENPAVLLLYAGLGIGFLSGLVIISRIFSVILKNHKTTAFYLVTGLSFGSIISMFINPDMATVYSLWNGFPFSDAIIGALLLVLGGALSFLLTKYELGRSK